MFCLLDNDILLKEYIGGKEMEIVGIVETIIFRNEENGYSVIEIKASGGGETHTAVGTVAYINEGEQVKIVGEQVSHPNYGEQIKIKTFENIGHSTIAGVERYLGSGMIKGIGKSMAKRIVAKFGMDTMDILQMHPERLIEIDGIGKKKAEQISQSFEEQREMRELMLFLQQYNLSARFAIKIYRKYGETAVDNIKENPYCLANDIEGIGFLTADRIAKNMGMDERSPHRIGPAIKYLLIKAVGKGHTYLPFDQIVEETIELLNIESELIEHKLQDMFMEQSLKLEKMESGQAVYLPAFYYAELNVCKRLIELTLTKCKPLFSELDVKIDVFEDEHKIELAIGQRKAVVSASQEGVMVITGGPGTGKTTIINCILELMEQSGLEVLLAAPTGRAAKRMSETTGREAKTIHRLLEYEFSETGDQFARYEDYPLEADAIIVDEMSMVDMLLMNSLLKAVPTGTRLILVGDVDQLPSVGAGNVLRDVINTGIVPVVKLDEIFRQAAESMIVVNAHKINHGELPVVNKENSDFFFQRCYDIEAIKDTIIQLVSTRLPDFLTCNPLKDIQVLTPMRKSTVGVTALNTALQAVLNPPSYDKEEREYREMVFREGDKVMQIKNNYKLEWIRRDKRGYQIEDGEGVFNGDVGYIDEINPDSRTITVLFDEDKWVEYEGMNLEELELAYAVTVHKSQGSEFDIVVMPMGWGPPMLMTRNLLYTAITRAKKMVVMVGREKTIQMMVENNHIEKRYSGLEKRFRNIMATIGEMD